MKKIVIPLSILFSLNVWSKNLSFDLTVRRLNFNSEKNYYEVSFNEMAAVYKSDKKFLKCLQDSLDSKKTAKIIYLGRELSITNCEN